MFLEAESFDGLQPCQRHRRNERPKASVFERVRGASGCQPEWRIPSESVFWGTQLSIAWHPLLQRFGVLGGEEMNHSKKEPNDPNWTDFHAGAS